MAYSRARRSRVSRRSTGYTRSKRSNKSGRSRRYSRPSATTVRIVLEQPVATANPAAMIGKTAAPKPKRAKF